MRLFLPTARQANWLIPIGLCALGYALYLRYLVVEQSSVGLACQAGAQTWVCLTRKTVIALFQHSAFGWAALAVSILNLVRPSVVLLAAALIAGGFGIVLYNTALSALAAGLLLLSFARRAPETE